METETLCAQSGGDALIIPDKSKEDSNVAQKIQAECDKKFNNKSDVISDDDEQTANGNGHVDDGDFNGHKEGQLNGNQNGKDVDDQLDSLNVSNDNEASAVDEEKLDEIKLQNGDSVEKPAENVERDVINKEETVENDAGKEEIVENFERSEEILENVVITEENVGNADKVHEEIASPTIIEEVCKVEQQQAAKPREEMPTERVVQATRIIEDDMKAQKEPVANGPRKGAIATSMDTESVRDAYNDIRADNSTTQWAVFKYEASRIVCSAKGVAFDEFKEQFDEDERAYGYIRLQTGDEMSKRHKFLFVTWIGPGVSVLKRAKMSIDKAIIKNVICNFAVELQLETLSEFDLPFFIESLNKASGANYGTGVRDI